MALTEFSAVFVLSLVASVTLLVLCFLYCVVLSFQVSCVQLLQSFVHAVVGSMVLEY